MMYALNDEEIDLFQSGEPGEIKKEAMDKLFAIYTGKQGKEDEEHKKEILEKYSLNKIIRAVFVVLESIKTCAAISWAVLKGEDPKTIRTHIQGTLSNNEVLASLRFHQNVEATAEEGAEDITEESVSSETRVPKAMDTRGIK